MNHTKVMGQKFEKTCRSNDHPGCEGQEDSKINPREKDNVAK
jgi:hypothetical protein